MNKPKANKLYLEWFEKGEHDLDSALVLFENNGYADTICFLCQQAAEKYLKGYLQYNKSEPPKIHSLPALLRLCAQFNKDLLGFIDEVKRLDKYYIDTRYPLGSPVEYSKEEAKDAIDSARGIVDLILKSV